MKSQRSHNRKQQAHTTQYEGTLGWLVPRLFAGSLEDAVAKLRSEAKNRKLTVIFTPNPEQVELAEREEVFEDVLEEADIFFPDGIGLVWAANRTGLTLQRVTGREVLRGWLEQPLSSLPKTLLLGGQSGAAAALAQQVDPAGHRVRGIEGYQDVTDPAYVEDATLERMLKTWKPEVIFVGFGAPNQEIFIVEHRAQLEAAGVKVAMAVGGAFDVLSGQLAAPGENWVRWNLEWLFRLLQQPWRWRRQMWLLRFVWRVVTSGK